MALAGHRHLIRPCRSEPDQHARLPCRGLSFHLSASPCTRASRATRSPRPGSFRCPRRGEKRARRPLRGCGRLRRRAAALHCAQLLAGEPGLAGYCMMPYEYLLNPSLASDFWTIRAFGLAGGKFRRYAGASRKRRPLRREASASLASSTFRGAIVTKSARRVRTCASDPPEEPHGRRRRLPPSRSSFAGAAEYPHFDRRAFKARVTFATLRPTG